MSKRKKTSNNQAIQKTEEFKDTPSYTMVKGLINQVSTLNNRRFYFNRDNIPNDPKNPILLDNQRILAERGVLFRPPYKIPLEDLEFLALNSILIGSINQLIVDIVKSYSVASETYGYGFKFKDREKTPDNNDKKRFDELEKFIFLMGDNKRNAERYPSVLEMATRDYLNFDSVCYLLTFNKAGKLKQIDYLDPQTIHRVDPKRGYQGDKNIEFVQATEDHAVKEVFEKGRLVYRHKNNISSVRHRYFGLSPLESCVTELMGQLYAAKRNNEKFDTRTMPKKLITTAAKINEQQRQELELQWENAFYGGNYGSSTRLPFLWGMADIQIHDLDWKEETFFDSFMQWVCAMILARYGVDSALLGLNFSQSKALSEASMDGRQKSSRDRIASAMMTQHAQDMNDILDSDGSEDYRFVFNGVIEDDRSKKVELQSKEFKFLKNIDELRKENDLTTYKDIAKDYLDSGIISAEQAKKLEKIGLMVSDQFVSPQLANILFPQDEGGADPNAEQGQDGQPEGEQEPYFNVNDLMGDDE